MDDTKSPESESRSEYRPNPAMNRAIERYIRTIVEMRLKAEGKRTLEERIAAAITSFSGRMAFVYIHVLWFGVWILWNTGVFGLQPFDPFPFGFLTMIVSLEAIFLATFVLISQNRMSAEDEQRANLDLHIDLLTEYELTRVLRMLDAIQHKLGIGDGGDKELADLEKVTRPEEVLEEIERLQEYVLNNTSKST
ncbi:MAG TPA: DUF1003 domain-containing protein [Anaerolineales bacterium]|nr:DUF1003 domain-containing protein [Anaerolineales bacterium]